MDKSLRKIISFGYKVSDGNDEGFAYFLQYLKTTETPEEKWRDVVVDIVAELPIDSGKQVLKAMLKRA